MAGLPYDQLLQNLIRQESGGKANALSHAGAAGVMQVMPGTAREIAAELGDTSLQGMSDQQIQQAMMDPARGKRYGEHYLQKMLNRYGGDQAAALVAYNGGPGRADAWLKNGRNDAVIPAETRNYYRSILGENIPMSGGAGSEMLAGGGGSDAMAATGSGGAAGSPFEGASDRQKWATWLAALGQSFRGRDNAETMQRLTAMESQGVNQNRTYQALVKRGIDPATAEWAVRDPQVMREVAQQLFAPKSKNMTISEIFDPATGRPVKVLVDQTTGEYQAIGGVSAPDPTKAPNLQAIEIYDDKGGGKRKVLLNPQTGEQTPIGGVAAADAPKETSLDKQIAKERVDLASGAIQSATAARGMLPIVAQLKAISDGDQGDLSRAIGGVQGYDTYQSTVGQLWGSPGLNAKIKNLSAQLNADLGRVWLAGQGSASDSERQMVRDAIGNLPFARDKDEFDNLLGQIETRINRKVAEGGRASKNVPGLDVTGGGKEGAPLRKITESELSEAQAAIQAGADRNKVLQRLRQNGINPAGL